MTGDPCPGCVEEVEGGAIAKGSGGISSGTCHFRQTNQLESMSKISLAWLFNGFFKAGVEDWKIENSSQFTAPACPLPAGDVPLPHPLRLHRSPVASASISPYHQTDWRTGVFAVAQNQVVQPTMLPNRSDRHSSTIYQTTSPCFLGSKHDNKTLIKPTFDA